MEPGQSANKGKSANDRDHGEFHRALYAKRPAGAGQHDPAPLDAAPLRPVFGSEHGSQAADDGTGERRDHPAGHTRGSVPAEAGRPERNRHGSGGHPCAPVERLRRPLSFTSWVLEQVQVDFEALSGAVPIVFGLGSSAAEPLDTGSRHPLSGDRLAEAFEQAFEVGHPLAQLADLLPEGLPLRVDPLA